MPMIADPPRRPRRPTWRADLSAYLAAQARRRFRPGATDCALFAAGAVQAMTGEDLAAAWRGTYRSLRAGQAALVAAGFADHVALAADLLPEIAPSYAAVGDVAVLPGEGTAWALGIVQGSAVYCLRPAGLALVSRLHITRAFAV